MQSLIPAVPIRSRVVATSISRPAHIGYYYHRTTPTAMVLSSLRPIAILVLCFAAICRATTDGRDNKNDTALVTTVSPAVVTDNNDDDNDYRDDNEPTLRSFSNIPSIFNAVLVVIVCICVLAVVGTIVLSAYFNRRHQQHQQKRNKTRTPAPPDKEETTNNEVKSVRTDDDDDDDVIESANTSHGVVLDRI
jgi:flagellar biosynthesis/type III secretory pathway M-ring protein FliF/YscJ